MRLTVQSSVPNPTGYPTGFRQNELLMNEKQHSHVLHCDIFEDLAVVDIPHSLVVPDLGGQQDGTENNSLPVTRTDVHLSVCQQPFQVNLKHRQ